MHTDPIADMLTRIRNSLAVGQAWVVAPSSKMKVAIMQILKDEGFVEGYEVVQDGAKSLLRIHLRYFEEKQPAINGLRRVSKPGLRIYVEKKEVPRFYGGRGISLISTSQGIMTGHQAWRQGLGGELLCYVW